MEKVEAFYKVKERKNSVARPIDPSDSIFASGGPSLTFVQDRELKRL